MLTLRSIDVVVDRHRIGWMIVLYYRYPIIPLRDKDRSLEVLSNSME